VALSITAAVAAVNVDDEANTWIKIEAEAKIDTSLTELAIGLESAAGDRYGPQHAIDLIVIIDNSFVP